MKTWASIHSGQWHTSKSMAGMGETGWKSMENKNRHTENPSSSDIVAARCDDWNCYSRFATIRTSQDAERYKPESILYPDFGSWARRLVLCDTFAFLFKSIELGIFFFLQPKPDLWLQSPVNSPITVKILVLGVVKPDTRYQQHKVPSTWYLLVEILQ